MLQANEMVHQMFNEQVFKLEQQEYSREGVKWQPVKFVDNQDTLSLIEGRLIPMFNEECMLPKGNEDQLLQKMNTNLRQSQCYVTERAARMFGIKHFAGPVTYSVENLLEKNKDTLPLDLKRLMEASSFPLAAELFPQAHSTRSNAPGGTLRLTSTCTKFRDQLRRLINTIKATRLHFIRCFKPNEFMAPSDFNGSLVLKQMKNVGVLETVKIRKNGFAFRMAFSEFASRNQLPDSTVPAVTKFLEDNGRAGEWLIGRTKVFLSSRQFTSLEKIREGRLRYQKGKHSSSHPTSRASCAGRYPRIPGSSRFCTRERTAARSAGRGPPASGRGGETEASRGGTFGS